MSPCDKAPQPPGDFTGAETAHSIFIDGLGAFAGGEVASFSLLEGAALMEDAGLAAAESLPSVDEAAGEEAVLPTEEGDVAIRALAGELNVDRYTLTRRLATEYGILPVRKRPPKSRSGHFISGVQAEIARNDPELVAPFAPEDGSQTSILDIMTSACVTAHKEVVSALVGLGYEKSEVRRFRVLVPEDSAADMPQSDQPPEQKVRILQHLPTPIANKVTDALNDAKLPPGARSAESYARSKGGSYKIIASMVAKLAPTGAKVSSLKQGRRNRRYLDATTQQLLDAHIESLEPPRPAWKPIIQVANILGVVYDSVKRRFLASTDTPQAWTAELQTYPGSLITKEHLHPDKIAEIAQALLRAKLNLDPDALLTLSQIGLLAGREAGEIHEYCARLDLPPPLLIESAEEEDPLFADEAYAGETLDLLLEAFGVEGLRPTEYLSTDSGSSIVVPSPKPVPSPPLPSPQPKTPPSRPSPPAHKPIYQDTGLDREMVRILQQQKEGQPLPAELLEQLTVQASQRDPHAFSVLTQQYHNLLRAKIAREVARNRRIDPDEILQATYEKAWQSLDKLRDPRARAAWIRWTTIIAVNAARDALKSSEYRRTLLAEGLGATHPEYDGEPNNILDALSKEEQVAAGSPVEHAVIDEGISIRGFDASQLAAALEQLSDSYREILHRRFWLEQTSDQVAAEMGLPSAGAAKTLQFRATRALENRLRELNPKENLD